MAKASLTLVSLYLSTTAEGQRKIMKNLIEDEFNFTILTRKRKEYKKDQRGQVTTKIKRRLTLFSERPN